MSDVDSKKSMRTERIIEESKAGEKMKELARKKAYRKDAADLVDRLSMSEASGRQERLVCNG